MDGRGAAHTSAVGHRLPCTQREGARGEAAHNFAMKSHFHACSRIARWVRKPAVPRPCERAAMAAAAGCTGHFERSCGFGHFVCSPQLFTAARRTECRRGCCPLSVAALTCMPPPPSTPPYRSACQKAFPPHFPRFPPFLCPCPHLPARSPSYAPFFPHTIAPLTRRSPPTIIYLISHEPLMDLHMIKGERVSPKA
eukprot:350189-Chlamydomonas_euryale.AAC.3